MDDYSNSFSRARASSSFDEAFRRVNEMHLDRLSSMFRNLDAVMNPNLSRLTNSVIINNLHQSSALEQAVKNLGYTSHVERAIAGISQASNLEALAQRMNLASTLQEVGAAASMFNRIAEHQNLLSKQILGSLSGIVDSTKTVLDLLRPQITAYQDWVLTHAATFERFGRFWEEFEANYHIAEYKAVRVLKKYNWFVSPSLPYEFVYEAVRLGRRKGNKLAEMNSLFWDYFADNDFENLTEMVEGWSENPLFKGKRMKILRDCTDSLRHAKRNYNPANVVVPTLIAQIDGVLTKFRKQKGFKKDRCPVQEIKVWFEAEAINQDVLSEQMLEVANYVLFSVLFQTSRYEEPLANPFTLSRHKIMHGESLTYGRRANVIRAFLILDFLAALE